jgi:release factor glutamine methyltransferase
MSTQVHRLLATAAEQLAPYSDSPELDAQVVLAHVFRKPRTWVLAHPTTNPDADQSAEIQRILGRLQRGEPLPYVLGHQAFYGLDFDLTPDVLIPRPETELLVERAIAWLKLSPDRRTAADVGTGSGCICISLAVHVPELRVLATDVSRPALTVAVRNSRKHRVSDRLDFVECDLLPRHIQGLPTERHFDLVCANLPYIPTASLRQLPVYRQEPWLALDGGADGLDPFRRFFDLVPEWMAPGGLVLLEVESSHGAAVLSLAYDAFHAAIMHLHHDLAGYDRLLELQLPSA